LLQFTTGSEGRLKGEIWWETGFEQSKIMYML